MSGYKYFLIVFIVSETGETSQILFAGGHEDFLGDLLFSLHLTIGLA